MLPSSGVHGFEKHHNAVRETAVRFVKRGKNPIVIRLDTGESKSVELSFSPLYAVKEHPANPRERGVLLQKTL